MQETDHTYHQHWLLPAIIATLCIVLEAADLSSALRFDREMVNNGSWWLLLSCNYVHLGVNHLLLNFSGLCLIYFLLWQNYSTPEWLIITLLSSVGVGVGIYLWSPDLYWYVGFSGALHGVMIAGAIADIRNYPKSGSALLALIVLKLSWEQLFGAVPGSEAAAGGHVAVDSHFYGAITGALCAFAIMAIKHLHTRHFRPQSNAGSKAL